MTFSHDAWRFIVAIFSQWQALVTGGVITAVITVYERRRGAPIPWRAYRWVIVAFLVAATFLAWQAESRRADQLSADNDGLREQLSKIPIAAPAPAPVVIAPNHAEADRLRRELQEARAKLDDRAKRNASLKQIASFMDEGRSLMAQCANEQEPPPQQATNDWAERTENVLASLNPSWVARFRSSAGVPSSANSIASIPHRNLWAGIRFRLARLEQFSQELDK